MNHLVRLAAAIIREKERIEFLLDLVEWIERLGNLAASQM